MKLLNRAASTFIAQNLVCVCVVLMSYFSILPETTTIRCLFKIVNRGKMSAENRCLYRNLFDLTHHKRVCSYQMRSILSFIGDCSQNI